MLGAMLAVSLAVAACSADDGDPRVQGREIEEPGPDGEGVEPSTSTTAGPPPADIWSDPAGAGAPYPGETVGLLTFRGNPSRTYYGEGPVPSAPKRLWS